MVATGRRYNRTPRERTIKETVDRAATINRTILTFLVFDVACDCSCFGGRRIETVLLIHPSARSIRVVGVGHRKRTRPTFISNTAPTSFLRPSRAACFPTGVSINCLIDHRTLASTACGNWSWLER